MRTHTIEPTKLTRIKGVSFTFSLLVGFCRSRERDRRERESGRKTSCTDFRNVAITFAFSLIFVGSAVTGQESLVCFLMKFIF